MELSKHADEWNNEVSGAFEFYNKGVVDAILMDGSAVLTKAFW